MEKEYKLVKKAKLGHKRAFGKLVSLYQDRILYFTYTMTGNLQSAQDIAQDTFITAYDKLIYLKNDRSFSTWIYRIATNLSLDSLSAKKRKKETFGDSQFWQNLEKNEKTVIDENIPVVNNPGPVKGIKKYFKYLTQTEQLTIVLKYYHDMKSHQISEIMNIEPSTVRTHIHRGIKKLKKFVKE